MNKATDAEQAIVRDFHELYYSRPRRTWSDTRWLGTRVAKCPLDLWIYQEILFERRPGLIIETGTYEGGSALFLASMLDLIGSGRVITIDLASDDSRPAHPRIEYRTGSSVTPDIVAGVRESVRPGERVMVTLDSDHHREHVLAELRAFAPLVTPGDYLAWRTRTSTETRFAPASAPARGRRWTSSSVRTTPSMSTSRARSSS